MKMKIAEASHLVIIGVDYGQTSENAFHVYAEKMHRPEDVVLVIHTIEVHSPHLYNSIFVRPEIERAEFEKEKLKYNDLRIKYEKLLEKYQMNGEYVCVAGTPGHTLCKLAKKHRAEQLVIGSHDKGKVARTLLGSISHYISRQAPCHVVVIKKTDKVC